MYWTDWGNPAKIERAGMNGDHREAIVTTDIMWPNGLTLDNVQKLLYWVDAKLNVIQSIKYDGSNRRTVLYSPKIVKHPFSITLFEDWMYWTDWENKAIYKANKFNGGNATAIVSAHMVSSLL